VSSVRECCIVELPHAAAFAGYITTVEAGRHVPFEIARVYYLYDMPEGAIRGGHAHKQLQQLIVAATGSFEVRLDDGVESRLFKLDRPDVALRVPRLVWRDLLSFSLGAVCLVLASLPYDETDYIRDYADFVRYAQSNRENSISGS
jgi:WxcM-like protein